MNQPRQIILSEQSQPADAQRVTPSDEMDAIDEILEQFALDE